MSGSRVITGVTCQGQRLLLGGLSGSKVITGLTCEDQGLVDIASPFAKTN